MRSTVLSPQRIAKNVRIRAFRNAKGGVCMPIRRTTAFVSILLPTIAMTLRAQELPFLTDTQIGYLAGEISGASSMILEHAPFGRRGYYASFTLQGVQAGQIFAAAVFLPLAAFMSAPGSTRTRWPSRFVTMGPDLISRTCLTRRIPSTWIAPMAAACC